MRNKKAVFLLTFIIIMALLSSGCLFNIRPIIEAISDQTGKVGQEFTYQVIAYDPDNGELTYLLTEKPEGMQIESSTGLITWTPGENQIGTFTIEAKVSNGNSFRLEQFQITIEDIYLNSIEVFPVTINVYIGNSNTVASVTAHYDYGDSADLAPTDCNYSSGNTGIATVSGSGVITGVSAGSTIVTVSYAEDGIVKTDTVSVTVENISLTSIEVSPDNMSVYIGNSNTINSITAFYNDRSSAFIGLYSADYSSNNPGIASVTTTGGVTGVSTGTATVTVSYTENSITKTDTVNVTVENISLTSITVFPSTMSMYSGSLKNITSVTANYNDGNSASVELSSADYSSNNPGIASVNTTGGITGVSTGSALITVTYTEDGIAKTDTVNVIIISPGGGGGGGGG